MSQDIETVRVQILDKDYQVACPAPQKEGLLEAARYLDALDSAWGPRLPARRIAARMGHHGAGFLRGAGWHPGPAPAAPEGDG